RPCRRRSARRVASFSGIKASSARRLVDRFVVGLDGLLLFLRQTRPILGRLRRRAVTLMDQRDVLHHSLLRRLVASKTNGERENGHGHRSTGGTLVLLIVHERLRLQPGACSTRRLVRASGLDGIVRDGAQRERETARRQGTPTPPSERELYVKARKLLVDEIGLARGIEAVDVETWIEDQLAGSVDANDEERNRDVLAGESDERKGVE